MAILPLLRGIAATLEFGFGSDVAFGLDHVIPPSRDLVCMRCNVMMGRVFIQLLKHKKGFIK